MSRSLVTLRVAELSDAPALAELWTDCHAAGRPADHIGDLELIIKAASASPEQRVVVAEYDGVLAGAVLLRVATLTAPQPGARPCRRSRRTCSPSSAGAGIGQALMECAVAFAEEIGIGHITTAAVVRAPATPTGSWPGSRSARTPTQRVAPTHAVRAKLAAARPATASHQRPPAHPGAGRPALDEADPGRPLGRRYFPIFSASTSAQVIREVQTRLPRSSVIDHLERRDRAAEVERRRDAGDHAGRGGAVVGGVDVDADATACRGLGVQAAGRPSPRVSASTTDAPPWSSP